METTSTPPTTVVRPTLTMKLSDRRNPTQDSLSQLRFLCFLQFNCSV